MMKKDTTMNLDVKSNLAKLLATENITIQHDNVKTASFDVKNRVLTLPIFKQQSGDVTDMLIAHECAHALWTPYEEWAGINDSELRSYVNVLEDTRIDKLIQAKYPGTVKNYLNGFDVLEKRDFFGLFGKDINTDLMIIDKINMRSKSLQRLPFKYSDKDKQWLKKVDAIKTFDDVVKLAKEILDWQKEQVEEMRKLPDFDNLSIAKNYDLDNDDDEDLDSNADGNSDDAEQEQNKFDNQKANDEKDANQSEASSEKSDEENKEEKSGSPEQYGNGAGGDSSNKLLKAVTDDSYAQKQDQLLDANCKGFVYGNLPEPNLKTITSYKQFLSTFNKYKAKQNFTGKYDAWLKDAYKKFKSDNKKTVMYLVKEFEMKKSATAYKRASTDKTGIIDPLKLPSYQYSDDIFKRLTIIPDGKNHGMMMLLDWSGSMSDTLMHTVEQLLNLVEFVKKVNIPFEVYFFTSERTWLRNNEGTISNNSFNYKDGDWKFEDFNLVNCFSHRMNKKELELAGMYMYHMATYYNLNYTRNWVDNEMYVARYDSYGIPGEFSLGNTPLNEALVFCNKLIPMFKEKYGIEKMSFITLTDGGANSFRHTKVESGNQYGVNVDYEKTAIIKYGKKKMVLEGYGELTNKLLTFLKSNYDLNNIGFYIIKRVRKWDIEKYMPGKTYSEREQQYLKARKQFTKDKALAVSKEGYDKYFLLDGKKMKVENFDLSEATVKKGTTSELKRIFGNSMKNRLVSRVVLSKFIEEVA